MKVYRYFLVTEENTTNIQEKYPLYAITDDKYHAAVFEATRNMKLFTKRVYKGSERECLDYLKRHQGNVLDYYDVETTTEHRERKTVGVLCTDIEFEMLTFDVTHFEFLKGDYIDPTIFNDKYLTCLLKIDYVACAMVNTDCNFTTKHGVPGFTQRPETLLEMFEPDELAVFLNMFHDKISLATFADHILDYEELEN